LRDRELNSEAKANLKIVSRSGEHLLALINDVLDMSRIEAGRMEVQSRPPSTSPASSAIWRRCSACAAQGKPLEFEVITHSETAPVQSVRRRPDPPG